jgi:hypothetical protein
MAIPPATGAARPTTMAVTPATATASIKGGSAAPRISTPVAGAGIDGAEYVVGHQLGDSGSHHRAYELVGNRAWVFLVRDGSKAGIEKTVADRMKAYSVFPESIIARMGEVTCLPVEGIPTWGVLLERMDGRNYHSTHQSWSFGPAKLVKKWIDEDTPSEVVQKIDRWILGVETFLNAGQVVDDFQFWVRDDGRFMLSDVKSAVKGNPREIHSQLVDQLVQLRKKRSLLVPS